MSGSPKFRFRLYIAGATQNSAQAIANLKALCETYLPNRHEIEFVDVFKEQRRAFDDRVFLTPTLIKLGPSPTQRIVGTLNEAPSVVQFLGLGPRPA
jgi:circadian clock protein KaiB